MCTYVHGLCVHAFVFSLSFLHQCRGRACASILIVHLPLTKVALFLLVPSLSVVYEELGATTLCWQHSRVNKTSAGHDNVFVVKLS